MRLIMITPQNPAQKPWIEREFRRLAANISETMFMITVNSPSVRNIIGRATSFNIGLMKEFMMPKTAPAIIRSNQFPRKINPGMRRSATKIATELVRI